MGTIFETTVGDLTIDESEGQQTAADDVTPTATEDDNDDNDIDPNSIAALLGLLAGLGAPLASAAIEAAQNQVLTFQSGVDPDLSFSLAGGVTELASSLSTTAGSDPITLVWINATTVFGYANRGLDGERVAFALVLEKIESTVGDPGGARITIVQYEAIEHPDNGSFDEAVDLTGLVYVDAAENLQFDDFSSAPAGQNLWTSVSDSGGEQILVTGLRLGIDTVNTRATSLGSNNQSIEAGEGLVFDFVTGQTPPTSTTAKSLANINFTDRVEGTEGSFTLVQVGGSATNRVAARVTAYDSSELGADFNDRIIDGAVQSIVAVEVWFNGQLVRSWDGFTASGSDTSVGFAYDGNGVKITGLLEGYQVRFFVDADTSALDRFVVENVSTGGGNKSFDLGIIGLGNQKADSVEVGSHLHFEDDGPTVMAALGTGSVTHDETAGLDGDADDTSAPAVAALFAGVANASADLAAAFAQGTAAVIAISKLDYGRDEEGGTTLYSLSVADADSGLDTTDGHSILLYKEGDLVVGRISGGADDGKAAFAVAIDASTGVLSLAQYASLLHPSGGASHDEAVSIANAALLATVTVTDGDGDVASRSVAIGSRVGFQDDGPTAMAALGSGGVTHDETVGLDGDADDTTAPAVAALFAAVASVSADMAAAFAQGGAPVIDASGSDYGQDEENGTTLYSLNLSAAGVDSGLDTTDGHSILLYKEDDLVVGRISGGADDGKAAFAVAIDASTGVLSLAQYASLWHADDGDPDDTVKIANSALFATVTVTDGDGDTHSASVAIGDRVAFQDDGPLAIDPEHGTLANAAGASGTFALDEDLLPASFADNFGEDGPAAAQGGVVFVGTDGSALRDTDGNALTSGGVAITLSGFGTHVLTASAGGSTVFTITLDGATGQYTVDMAAEVDNGAISFSNFGSGGAGLRYWLGVAGSEDVSRDLLVSAGTPGVNTVNNDSDDIATGNQWIDPNELIRLDFVSGIATTTGSSNLGDIPVATHYLANDVGFTVMQTKANSLVDVRITAIDAARDIDGTDGTPDDTSDDTSVVSDLQDGTPDIITFVRVINGGTEKTYTGSIAGEVTFNADGSVTVYNIDAPDASTRDQVFVSTASGFSRLEILNVDANKQDALAIGGFELGGQAGEPVEMAFEVNVVDGDGDTALGLIGVTLEPASVI
ncbi:DUF5801 repeats-in-toxin domain-containing protein [Azotobacter salinestris]|uniref:DUF5801 repeats-in-toxin domain-containing protein n=1 Tax=Azotobacter salinestris TaxID=69964 RepID=UPI0032DF868D